VNIVKLESSNIKRLKAVQITPEGNMVVIGGNNGQGKTSVLDSILYSIGGGNTHCERPVRQGEDKAKIVCELDGGIVITRTFTAAGGTNLVVSNKEGARYSSPQAMLDAMVGKLTFDPLEFTRMDSKRQVEALRTLVGLDLSGLDQQRKDLYDQRTVVNREVKSVLAGVEAFPFYEGVPQEEVSASELAAELKRRQALNAGIVEKSRALGEIESRITKGAQHIAMLEDQIAGLERQLKQSKEMKISLESQAKQMNESLLGVVQEDEASILVQLDDIQDINKKVASNASRMRLSAKAQDLQAQADEITAKIEDIDKQKAAALASATFPVPGLSFDESQVLLHGIPFSQASDAEKIRVSVSMGMAMNPKLKVILIRDGSLLDSSSLSMIAHMAKENDAQVWIERVGEGSECTVIIEDGQVKES